MEDLKNTNEAGQEQEINAARRFLQFFSGAGIFSKEQLIGLMPFVFFLSLLAVVYTDASGAVLEDRLRVERTSGYGRLDRLAVDHLKLWKFEPVGGDGRNEWGVITFRFILE